MLVKELIVILRQLDPVCVVNIGREVEYKRGGTSKILYPVTSVENYSRSVDILFREKE